MREGEDDNDNIVRDCEMCSSEKDVEKLYQSAVQE